MGLNICKPRRINNSFNENENENENIHYYDIYDNRDNINKYYFTLFLSTTIMTSFIQIIRGSTNGEERI